MASHLLVLLASLFSVRPNDGDLWLSNLSVAIDRLADLDDSWDIWPGYVDGAPYYGVHIGKLNTMFHDVTGDVYAVDENTLFLKGFTYDGTGPDAYFWAGNTVRPDTTGIIIPDEKGSTKPLGAYSNQDIVLRLPEGKTLRDIRWFSVWCRRFKANFGDIILPKNLEIPEPVELSPLTSLEHGVSSGPITILDAQTFLVPNFKYDGEGPAAYWWVSRGARQSPSGTRLKDENGSSAPLKRYTGRTVVISLPERNTIYDYDWLGVWCEEFNADFGHVRLPQNIKVPPSPRMLGVRVEVRPRKGIIRQRPRTRNITRNRNLNDSNRFRRRG